MNIKEAHTKFLEYLESIKNNSQKTVEQYDRHLKKFEEYLKEKGLENINVEKLNLEIFEDFRASLYRWKKKISVKTANAYMITMRSFLKFLWKRWLDSLAPWKIDLIKHEDRRVEFLTEEELDRLFNCPDTWTITGLRDLAIMKCIYSTGLRISELTNLNIENIDLERKEFAVRWKWRKLRVVYLTDDSAESIRKYLQKRNDHLKPLFIRHNAKAENIDILTDENMRLSRFFITTMIKKYAKQAIILKDIWHASITTTQVYTHVTNQKLKEVHKKFMK